MSFLQLPYTPLQKQSNENNPPYAETVRLLIKLDEILKDMQRHLKVKVVAASQASASKVKRKTQKLVVPKSSEDFKNPITVTLIYIATFCDR